MTATTTTTEPTFVTTWSGLSFDRPLELVRRDSLKPGDVVYSSHYGLSVVERAAQYGTEGQTTELEFAAPAEHDRRERYDSAQTIPLVRRFHGWSEEIQARSANESYDRMIARTAPDYGHGNWTEPRLRSGSPIWHLFPGTLLEAKFDGRIAALLEGEDVVVVGIPQHDDRWNREFLLVEGVESGRRAVLSASYQTLFYPTVPSFVADADGFTAQNVTGRYPLAEARRRAAEDVAAEGLCETADCGRKATREFRHEPTGSGCLVCPVHVVGFGAGSGWTEVGLRAKYETLTPGALFALSTVVEAASGHKRVRRYDEATGNIIEGTARYLSGDGDSPRPDDLRDAYLRVTTLSGFEVWWPVVELAEQSQHGAFAVDS